MSTSVPCAAPRSPGRCCRNCVAVVALGILLILAAGAAPAADKDRKPAAAEKPPAARRLDNLTAAALCKQLSAAPEFGLSPAVRKELAEFYANQYRTNARLGMLNSFDPSTLLRLFPPARDLPIRYAPTCQLNVREAATLGVLARKLHAYLDLIAPPDEDGHRKNPDRLREVLSRERRGRRPEWLRPEAVPAMVQILMAEDVPLRLVLVDMLAEVDAKPATVRLAQRAVFDVSPEVRQAAIEALRDRPAADYRPVFLDAFRYPWPPAAEHAAEALISLEDREAVPLLVALLSKPDPTAPFPSGSYTCVREVVRLTHVANCLLCHVPAVSNGDAVTGPDPLTPVPPGGSGWGSKRSSGSQSLGIRADVQFLRQDFSVTLPAGWGTPGLNLRFDFLVRTRRLSAREVRDLKRKPAAKPTTYPQREAVLFALRGLTDKDVGPTAEAWLRLYPHANAEAEGVRLGGILRRAAPAQRDRLLATYRDAKDERYTEGLAYALPHLDDKLRMKTRTALVERLARLPADRLRARLEDEHFELRHAAALACIRKADKELVPELTALLRDRDREVRDGAQEVLRRLTGKEFDTGPDPE